MTEFAYCGHGYLNLQKYCEDTFLEDPYLDLATSSPRRIRETVFFLANTYMRLREIGMSIFDLISWPFLFKPKAHEYSRGENSCTSQPTFLSFRSM